MITVKKETASGVYMEIHVMGVMITEVPVFVCLMVDAAEKKKKWRTKYDRYYNLRSWGFRNTCL